MTSRNVKNRGRHQASVPVGESKGWAMDKPDLKEMSPSEMRAFCERLGEQAYRARQVFRWVHGRGAVDWREMTDLPRALRERLARVAVIGRARVLERQEDRGDGTVKLLLELADGETVETVLLRHRYGNSVCVSTQVGCRMGCAFCASTVGGLVRPLTAGEMAEQVLAIQRDLGAAERVSRVVLMGIGEPLENYDAVVKFLRLIHEPDGLGISYRNMTLSTSGLVPGIRRLAGEGLPVTLAVSLHAPNDELRSRLVPVSRRHPIAELLAACDEYAAQTGRRVTFEYALIDGVNDLPELARELGRLLQGRLCHVNLIPLNPSGRGLAGSPPERVREFQEIVTRYGISTTVRRELGAGIDAACGQLRRRRAAEFGVPVTPDGRDGV